MPGPATPSHTTPGPEVTRPRVAVWGTGGHARVVCDILRLAAEYEIAGHLDDFRAGAGGAEFAGAEFGGAPVLGGAERLAGLRALGITHVILAFGDGEARLRLAESARAHGLALATAVHPRAVVAADAVVGAGTVVAAGAVVCPGARIGENVIVNTCASADHDCVVGDGAHLCPGVHLAGNVVIGRAAWVGVGACVRDGVRIGAGAVVGVGSAVVRDVPAHTVAYGVPARPVRAVGP